MSLRQLQNNVQIGKIRTMDRSQAHLGTEQHEILALIYVNKISPLMFISLLAINVKSLAEFPMSKPTGRQGNQCTFKRGIGKKIAFQKLPLTVQIRQTQMSLLI